MFNAVRRGLAALCALALGATAAQADTGAPLFSAHSGAVIEAASLAPTDASATGLAVAPILPSEHAIATIAPDTLRFDDSLFSGANLEQLVAANADAEIKDGEQDCLAGAVYFEARGEPLDGQLAVAEVVLNRAKSGRYPPTICGVVTQKAQFSFIRAGRFPPADRASDAWRKAVAISRIALDRLAAKVPAGVLWYHATYVSPSWGKRLREEARIGLHIFYS